MENIRVSSADGVSRTLHSCLGPAQISAAWLIDKASSSYCFIIIRWEEKGSISYKSLLSMHLIVGFLKVVAFLFLMQFCCLHAIAYLIQNENIACNILTEACLVFWWYTKLLNIW